MQNAWQDITEKIAQANAIVHRELNATSTDNVFLGFVRQDGNLQVQAWTCAIKVFLKVSKLN